MNINYEKIINSVEEVYAFANEIAKRLRPNDVITLEGDLGAGKTTFTKGLAKGLNINKNVNSPTFTIIKEYYGDLPLFHMDVYRLNDVEEDLGFDEYFNGDGVTVVEWAHLIEEFLPENLLAISIYRIDETTRKFILHPKGTRYEKLCEELF